MKQILFSLFVTGLSAISFAQNWQWARQGVGANDDYGNGIATDLNANVYVTGYFFSPVITFDNCTLANTGCKLYLLMM